MSDITLLTTSFGVLVIVTTAITELFKGMFPKLPTQILATIIALFCTVCAIFTYVSIKDIPVEWYIIVGSIVAGFFVSYTSQYGYDKAKEILKLITGKGKTNGESETKSN